MALDELANRPCKHHHKDHGHDDSHDHYREIIRHADGGDDRVQGEHSIEQKDLNNDACERRLDTRRGMPLLALEFRMDLVCALAEQEQPTEDEDQITT